MDRACGRFHEGYTELPGCARTTAPAKALSLASVGLAMPGSSFETSPVHLRAPGDPRL